MATKHDIVTFFKSITTDAKAAVSIGGAVPTGKTRFVTYARIERTERVISGFSGLTGLLCEAPNKTTLSSISSYASAVSVGKLQLNLAGCSASSHAAIPDIGMVNQVPDRPDVDHPLLSIAGGKYMYFAVPKIPAASLFVQYFDE